MGNILGTIAPNSRISQQFPPSPVFDPDRDIPDLTGKVRLKFTLMFFGHGGSLRPDTWIALPISPLCVIK
jgi:hypothetical protein